MKRAKTAHVPLAFVPFEGGWFHPPGAVDLLMVVVDMVDVDVDGFRCVKK